MKCRPLRHGDQMQCPCGLAWDVDEEKPQCRNAVQIVEQVELSLECRYCDGSGYFYGDKDLGRCGCPAGEKVAHPNGNPKFSPGGMLLDENGDRSIFDDVDE